MSGAALAAELMAIAGVVFGYIGGRLRPYDRLERWNWRRITFGPREGSRLPIGWHDVIVFAVVHPGRFLRSQPWSPFYRPPEPTPRISLDELSWGIKKETP